MSRMGNNLLAAVLGCSMLAAGTAVAFAASDTTQPAPSDAQLSHRVMQKLTRELPDSFVGLQVQSNNGVVTLSGRADTGLSKLKAEQDARRVPGVTEVKDHLRIMM